MENRTLLTVKNTVLFSIYDTNFLVCLTMLHQLQFTYSNKWLCDCESWYGKDLERCGHGVF